MIDVGQTVGNYNITAKLGEGGMGTVFLAEHPVIGSRVALKAIHPQFAASAEVVGRFVNEAKAVNQIGHDHIVDITDFGTAPTGDFYFTMEYLQGESLGDAIKNAGAFPPARALSIAAQIADALSASHEHGIIHRDLKPENVILIVRDSVRDFVKVLDFGLAKLTHVHVDAQPAQHSRTGSVMGTPYYMSPEQCEGRAGIDHRADIYALGVMLFEMLTGKIPFGGTGYGEIIVKHVTVLPPAASSIVPELSSAMDAILFRALAKAPDERFATMAEFREALLDPERYGASAPVEVAPEELTGRVRAAMPMARTELSPGNDRPSSPQYIDGLGKAPSTFRDSVGEVWVREEGPTPKRHRGGLVLLVGLMLAGGAVAGVRYRRQATHFLNVEMPAKPTTVRVTFNSDPNGATVARPDGTVLGVTPLSTDVPYGTEAVEYIVRMDGYLAMAASIVPNLPSPFFAALKRDERTPLPALAAPEPPPTLDPLPPLTTPAAKRAPHLHAPHVAAVPFVPPEPDLDQTLAPTAP